MVAFGSTLMSLDLLVGRSGGEGRSSPLGTLNKVIRRMA